MAVFRSSIPLFYLIMRRFASQMKSDKTIRRTGKSALTRGPEILCLCFERCMRTYRIEVFCSHLKLKRNSCIRVDATRLCHVVRIVEKNQLFVWSPRVEWYGESYSRRGYLRCAHTLFSLRQMLTLPTFQLNQHDKCQSGSLARAALGHQITRSALRVEWEKQKIGQLFRHALTCAGYKISKIIAAFLLFIWNSF